MFRDPTANASWTLVDADGARCVEVAIQGLGIVGEVAADGGVQLALLQTAVGVGHVAHEAHELADASSSNVAELRE